ncbi:hypothetical protein [Desulfobacter curvatus]|uniref:hypothetical protein n=1 Tax=Desulfobacter curvatus TaxID=2290 RepID=UPI0003827F3F|nr:hypothetical protein [Desulfobacter curvatus]
MNKLFLTIIIAAGLILPAEVLAGSSNFSKEAPDPITITLARYKAEGYSVIGPVQYLGKTKTKIFFYNQPSVSYKILRMIKPDGRIPIFPVMPPALDCAWLP